MLWQIAAHQGLERERVIAIFVKSNGIRGILFVFVPLTQLLFQQPQFPALVNFTMSPLAPTDGSKE
jgi:hypothetical protein